MYCLRISEASNNFWKLCGVRGGLDLQNSTVLYKKGTGGDTCLGDQKA